MDQEADQEKVGKVVVRLTDDYHRQGGYLGEDEVLQAFEKFAVSVVEASAIRSALKTDGVEVDGEGLLDGSAPNPFPEEPATGVTPAFVPAPTDDTFELFLRELGEVELLSPDQVVILMRRIRAGERAAAALGDGVNDGDGALSHAIKAGDAARVEFVRANLPLVLSIAKHYARTMSLDMGDLVQEGSMGLMRAVEKFDHTKGFRFSTYGTYWIRQSITRALADKDRLIRLPVWVVDQVRRIRRTRWALTVEKQGSAPTARDIAVHLNCDAERVQFFLDAAAFNAFSLQDSAGDDDDTLLEEFVGPPSERNPETLAVARRLTESVLAAVRAQGQGAASDPNALWTRRRPGLHAAGNRGSFWGHARANSSDRIQSARAAPSPCKVRGARRISRSGTAAEGARGMTSTDDAKYEACSTFVRFLDERILRAARGDDHDTLEVEPTGRFWLGRLASEEAVLNLGLGDRGERLDPCATGIVLRPANPPPWRFDVRVRLGVWLRNSATKLWSKSYLAPQDLQIDLGTVGETRAYGRELLQAELARLVGRTGFSCEVRADARSDAAGRLELAVVLVNTSPESIDGVKDSNLYECSLEVSGIETTPFLLEALPDSFRYDRRVLAYGINCGVAVDNRRFITQDTVVAERSRPIYWSSHERVPDLSFKRLRDDPLPELRALVTALEGWGQVAWAPDALDARAARDEWSATMRAEAAREAGRFAVEAARVRAGVAELEGNETLLRAFKLMNRAIEHSSRGKYAAWRPFQMGFVLANLRCITHPAEEAETADVVWFATGGGKTETYLGFVITAALYERMSGKSSGVTAWSRFPLRMLSLQQTQRFADAMAGAELARREAGIPGKPFAVGFLVGDSSTPNRIRREPRNEWEPDPDDEKMPARFRVLQRCPFCDAPSIKMAFDRRQWRLEHQCTNEQCPWEDEGLPFYIVDEEIFRFLPTVVIGTLDKAALISVQASMRGLIGPPQGLCKGPGHGYTYAARSDRPSGCLVPGCRAGKGGLDMAPERFGPALRLQDELHLLKDSLGAVDAHYEAILDHLESELTGQRCKILASSATLTGFEKQVDVLYRRAARVFPLQGPSITEGFWTTDSDQLARRFVAVAPRGVTLEFAVDRSVTELQHIVRQLRDQPTEVCAAAGIDPAFAQHLLSMYGTDVIYGNTLRDLEAVTRSLETQVPVAGPLHTANLTGKTQFEEVRSILDRLEGPEPDFNDRLHVVTASAMMSHGVDVDRLNVMTVLGLPLTTAEFIQATARAGRRWPALVLVMHKIARERDASVYRSFEHFVRQGDRFVEAVPVTRRSRRVLERTFTGLLMARVLAIHEPKSGAGLTTASKLRAFAKAQGMDAGSEYLALCSALGLDGPADEPMRQALKKWLNAFFDNLLNPVGSQQWPSDLSPTGAPMRSLRDVEEQAPITGMVT